MSLTFYPLPATQERENERLRRLAARLGVKPLTAEDDYRHLVFSMTGAESYDLVEILSAFLERLDATTSSAAVPPKDTP